MNIYKSLGCWLSSKQTILDRVGEGCPKSQEKSEKQDIWLQKVQNLNCKAKFILLGLLICLCDNDKIDYVQIIDQTDNLKRIATELSIKKCLNILEHLVTYCDSIIVYSSYLQRIGTKSTIMVGLYSNYLQRIATQNNIMVYYRI